VCRGAGAAAAPERLSLLSETRDGRRSCANSRAAWGVYTAYLTQCPSGSHVLTPIECHDPVLESRASLSGGTTPPGRTGSLLPRSRRALALRLGGPVAPVSDSNPLSLRAPTRRIFQWVRETV
jgi:hypothetical protein